MAVTDSNELLRSAGAQVRQTPRDYGPRLRTNALNNNDLIGGMQKHSFHLGALVSLSVMRALYEATLFGRGAEPSPVLVSVSQILFVLLLVLWVDQDSRSRTNVYRPFEFSHLVFLYWIPYLPYYLWKTRRASGMAMALGFTLLFHLGYVVQWVIYIAA